MPGPHYITTMGGVGIPGAEPQTNRTPWYVIVSLVASFIPITIYITMLYANTTCNTLRQFQNYGCLLCPSNDENDTQNQRRTNKKLTKFFFFFCVYFRYPRGLRKQKNKKYKKNKKKK